MSFHPDKFPDNEIDSLKAQLDSWLGDILPPPPPPPPHDSLAGNLDPSGTPGSDESASSVEISSEPSDSVAKTDYDLGESFLVYRLDVSPFLGGEIPYSDLEQLVQPTNRWHHQLIANRKAIGYSRSLMSDNAVSQMFISDLAGAIQDAIVWLNAFEIENPQYTEELPLVRLLVVPGFNVYAFWIQRVRGHEDAAEAHQESHVLVISAPSSMANLPRERLLDTKQFLAAFQGATPMLGLTAGNSGS